MSMDLGRLLAAAGGDVNVIRALSGAGDFEIIADGDDIYLRFALLKLMKSGINKEWVKVSASELGIDRAKLMTSLNAGPASVDTGSLVGFLQGAGAEVAPEGLAAGRDSGGGGRTEESRHSTQNGGGGTRENTFRWPDRRRFP